MPREIKAAIFDMDGTLLDTMAYWRYTTLEYLLAHDIPFTNDDLLRMHDVSSRALLMEILTREGVPNVSREQIIREVEAYMNRHYLYDARLKEPAVPEFLETLKQRGIRMCVSTGSPREYARNGLARLGILKYFEFVTDSYEYEVGKGFPEHFDIVAERLGTTAEHCVVFEDALYAMENAKKAGCAVVAIEDATARRQKEEILNVADKYILSYRELL